MRRRTDRSVDWPVQEVYFAFPFAIGSPDFRSEGSDSVIKPFRDQFPGSNTNYYAVQQSDILFRAVESYLREARKALRRYLILADGERAPSS